MDETPVQEMGFHRACLDALGDHIAILDSQGTILAVNASWQRFRMASSWLGTSDSVGANYFSNRRSVVDSNALLAIHGIRDVLSGTRSSFYLEYPDETRWFALRVTSIPDYMNTAVVAYADITARKEAEAELEKSRVQMQDFAEISADIFWETDASMRYTYYQRGASSLLGEPVGGTLGQNRMMLLEQSIRVDEFESHRNVISERRAFRNSEFTWRGPDDLVKTLMVTGKPIIDDNGVFQGYRGTGRDITAVRQAEEETRTRRDELAHATRFAMMGEMIFGLAHELNQPLAAAVTAAEAGQQLLKSGGSRAESLGETLEHIVAQTQRAGKIIQSLRRFVRKDKLEREILSMNEIVRDVLTLLTYDLHQGHVQLRLELDKGLPVVKADRVELEQVTLNLVRNALDAMINSNNAPRMLTIKSLQPTALTVQVDVTDNGEGLPPATNDDRSTLFEPFVTTRDSGMGMGLSISRSIVEAHGGRLWASQNPEQGATFHFVIPEHVVADD